MIIKRTLPVLLIKFCLAFTACESKVKQPLPAATASIDSNKVAIKSSGCSYYISQTEGEDMIDQFKKIYRGSGAGSQMRDLRDSFWMDSCVFMSLHRFLSSSNGYDGVRFFMAGKGKSELLIVPTKKQANQTANSKHSNEWGSRVSLTSKCAGLFKNINLGKNLSEAAINNFGERFREEGIRGNRGSAKVDSLSAGVWMDTCVIATIANILRNPAHHTDGIMVLAAAYQALQGNASDLGQFKQNQSTLIFVPTSKVGGADVPQWDILKNPNATTKAILGGFNHSQLCPQICD